MAATDALIAFLDEVDSNDGDEEPCVTDGPHDELDEEREPSLAHTLDSNQERARRHPGLPGTSSFYGPDVEAEHDGREPDEDMEPEPAELDDADD
jgi:hypothetical protein